MDRIKVSKADPQFKKIVAACYPGWKGRKLAVEARTRYSLSNYWDGGTRDYVVAYDLATGQVRQPHPATTSPFQSASQAEVEIPEGVVLVEHSIFCGKDAGVTIYANPANMPKLLPEATR